MVKQEVAGQVGTRVKHVGVMMMAVAEAWQGSM